MLKPHLLRRTKQSTLNGQRLLNLPEKTVEMEYILFSPEEAALYKAVEARARLRVNKWLKRGDNVKTWRCAFVLLTRSAPRELRFDKADCAGSVSSATILSSFVLRLGKLATTSSR